MKVLAMKTCLNALLLVALLGIPSALSAQLQFCQTDCMNTCTSSSFCDTGCTLHCDTPSTCGEYGLCDPYPDPDGDSLISNDDNCPFTYNPDQANCDGDQAGDACDSQNATYQQLTPWQPCYVVDRAHFGYMDQTLWQEAVFRDTSSCHSPDEVRNISRVGRCTGYFPPSYASSCCLSLWGPAACDYLRNNQCSTVQ